jgi:hypothetical protein
MSMDLSVTNEAELKRFLDTKELELATSLLECEVIDAGKAEVLKRLKIRVRAVMPIVYTHLTNVHCAHTRDVSVGGAYILTSDPLPVGAKIALTLRITTPFRLDLGTIGARVVRVNEIDGRERAGFAVEFENLTQDHIKILFKFVNENLKLGGS